jgi:hypothetical protein
MAMPGEGVAVAVGMGCNIGVGGVKMFDALVAAFGVVPLSHAASQVTNTATANTNRSTLRRIIAGEV